MAAINLRDAIKIVPLKSAAPRQPPPGLSYRGGPLIKNVAIHTLYWGSYWATASGPSMADIDAFFTFVVQSPFITQLSEYSVSGYPIGLGSFAQSSLLNVAVGPSLTDAEIQTQLRTLVDTKPSNHPPIMINDLHFVFTPPGVSVIMGGGASCTSFCGYHDDISGAIYYAVVSYPNCVGCDNAGTVFDSLTMVASHELAESITDPVPGAGWYDNQNGEIGDFCNAQPKALGAYTVQKIWSANAHQCI